MTRAFCSLAAYSRCEYKSAVVDRLLCPNHCCTSNAEHPALTKATANIASEEQDLHGNIRILRICADKASDDFLIVGSTERTNCCKQIQTVRHCACVGNCAILCVGNIRLIFQMIQHFNSSNQTAQEHFITQTP